MELICPTCGNTLVVEQDTTSISCPTCGSEINGTHDLSDVPATVVLKPGKKTLGHFQLKDLVGKGHFGEVWKAFDTRLKRTVAIKIPRGYALDLESVKQFKHEAQAAARLNHPHIIPVHEVGQEDDQIYIVSDFIDGQTLDRFAKKERLSIRAAVEMVKLVASALDHAHESGIVHRDVKPQNIMVDRQGQPFVTDFGLARYDGESLEATVSGVIKGTFAFMSPEQARGENRLVDRRTDVYALGIILYELITGQRPFEGSMQQLLDQIQNEEPLPPRQLNRKIPPDLEKICLKALSKSREQRYQTCREFQEDLQRFLNDEPVLARRPSILERGRRMIKRRQAAFTVGTSATACVLATFAFVKWFSPTPSPLPIPDEPPARRVTIDTVPSGASIAIYPLDSVSGEPMLDQAIRPQEKTPVEFETNGGDLLVIAAPDQPGFGFHEVIRHVPVHDGESPEMRFRHRRWVLRGDVIELPAINFPSDKISLGMAEFEGSDDFVVGDILLTESPPFQRKVAGFYLDTKEVTLGEWLKVFEQIPAFMNGKAPIPEHFALPWVSYDEALAYAETTGKRLPTEFEYECAATMNGKNKYPWGDEAGQVTDWQFGPSGSPAFDQTAMQPPVFGLYSNLGEWTMSWFTLYPEHREFQLHQPNSEDLRVIRGAPNAVITGQGTAEDWARGPRTRLSHDRHSGEASVGFRCARSPKPRLNPEDF